MIAAAVRDVTRPLRRAGARRDIAEAAELVPPVLARAAGQGLEAAVEWRAGSGSWTSTGTATFVVGPAGGPRRAVLRLTATGADRLRHESRVLAALADVAATAGWGWVAPRRLAEGAVGRWWFVLDEHVDGVDATALAETDRDRRGGVLHTAARAATELHRATARPVVVDDELLERWVGDPIRGLVRALHGSPVRCRPDRLERLRARLRDGLHGRTVHAGWVHGDFWLGNVRVDPGSLRLTGVVDWDCAAGHELPAHDLLHLALYGASLERGASLGAVVAQVLSAGTWPPECEELVAPGRWAWPADVPDSTLALLYWLRYVAAMAAQHRSYSLHSMTGWQLRNVAPVLRRV